MTHQGAVCYVASRGHMFQTALSALQARRAVDADTEVFVVFLTRGDRTEAEARVFADVLSRHGVVLLRLDEAELGGLHPTFGRYLLDRALPRAVDRVVYLDGDTQVLGDLSPLVAEEPGAGGVAACLDPMVLLHRVHPAHRRTITRWWDRSAVEVDARDRYVNSGVLVLDRAGLADLGHRVRTHAVAHPHLVFPDQDSLNAVAGRGARVLSMRWNFPGFLLGTAAEPVVAPQVVHFMSRPRPWNAPLPPWGADFHAPYRQLAQSEPTLAPYWTRFGPVATTRYAAQQSLKSLTERRRLARPEVGDVLRLLEGRADLGGHGSTTPRRTPGRSPS